MGGEAARPVELGISATHGHRKLLLLRPQDTVVTIYRTMVDHELDHVLTRMELLAVREPVG